MPKKVSTVDQTVESNRPSDLIPAETANLRLYDDDQLRAISSFDDALALAAQANDGLVDAAQEIGDGFALLDGDQKGRLVGIPLIFLEWSFHDGDFGNKFVAARVVTRNPDGGVSKYIITDGSTGICDTLAAYQAKTGRVGGLVCRNGLRASEYTYCVQCGTAVRPELDTDHANDHRRAVTYYIDTSAS